MTIQINSDNNITGTEGLQDYVQTTIAESLKRFDEQVTRIEVHLNDENGDKSGVNDKRCLMEARLEGMQPIAVTAFANNIHDAVKGAIEKLKSALDTAIGRLKNH